MSTNANIIVEYPDKWVFYVYLHFDGHRAGGVLVQHYNSFEKAAALVALGDLSSLGARLAPEPDECHVWGNTTPDVTVAYHRERGDMLDVDRTYGLARVPDRQYSYLFRNDAWHVKSGLAWTKLEDPLNQKM